MYCKKILLSSFTNNLKNQAFCLRPDNEKILLDYLITQNTTQPLARGSGLSYNDSCLNHNKMVIDTQRFNHLIHFDENTGILICQGGVRFKDLYEVHPEFIPPVAPGTMHATVAGGLAHDIHGKNNTHEGSFGDHVLWCELIINNNKIRCSREVHADLFYATIAGLGLTGMITQLAIRLKRASRWVDVTHTACYSLNALLEYLLTHSTDSDYQAAWVDLLNPKFQAIISQATHTTKTLIPSSHHAYTVPPLPLNLVRSWNMRLFNRIYAARKPAYECLSLKEFNHPLDSIRHWNRLYGPKGFTQFQAVFDSCDALNSINTFLRCIEKHKATPTLAVLKVFKQAGEGMLSFCKPGITIAIDFINNSKARETIKAMNQYVQEINGSVYLAKDQYLTPEIFKKMYANHESFCKLLTRYGCNIQSDLSKRLGIV